MNADIIEKIRCDFSPAEADEVLASIEKESVKKGYEPSPRILRCILFLAKGDIDAYKIRWQEAEEDYRDVIMTAEYDHFRIQLRDFNRPFGSEIVPDPLEAQWKTNQSSQKPRPTRAELGSSERIVSDARLAASLRGMSQKPTSAQKKAFLVKLAVVALVLLVVAVLVFRGLDVRALLSEMLKLMREVGPEAFFAAMALVPSAGVPLSAFWLSAAPAFAYEQAGGGPGLGLPLVIALCGLSLAVNLAITYWLARYAFRPPLVWLVRRLGYTLPTIAKADQVSVAVLVRLTPGPPYCVQCYLLGLGGIPFRTYMLVSWPISMAFGVVFIYFGDSLAQGKGKLAFASFCALLALAVGFKFLRRRMLNKKKEAGVEPTMETTPSVKKTP